MSRLEKARIKLRGRYLSRLPGSIEALRVAISDDPPDRETLNSLSHKLLGSGATYGFAEISEAALTLRTREDLELSHRVEMLVEACERACEAGDAEIASDLSEPAIVEGPVIVIVEDDPAMADVIAELVRSFGFTPVRSMTVQDARRRIAENDPALVLLDMNLPDGSGLDLAPSLVREDGTHIPSLALTSVDDAATRERAIAVGLGAYMNKPLEPGRFEENLRSLVSPVHLSQAQAASEAG